MSLQIGQQLGDYRIVETIGAGGMGQVYLADHLHLRKRYALKVLPAELAHDRGFVDRFADEAHVMAELSHPHIVQVHNMSHDGQQYFIAMDYVTGPKGKPLSVHDYLHDRPDRRLPQKLVHLWALQIASALKYAHRRGVVHRDLKPANLLIDPKGNLRLTDFGLAKAIGQEFLQKQIHATIGTLSVDPTIRVDGAPPPSPTEQSLSHEKTVGSGSRGTARSSSAQSLLGTYDYMAPEQRGELPDATINETTDIYAFGVMLYRMLSGQRPAGMAKPPSRTVKGLSPRWDAIVERCLEKQQKDRYPSAEALIADLKAMASGDSTQPAAKPSAAHASATVLSRADDEPAGRGSRTVLLAAGGGIAAVVIVGIALMLLMFRGQEPLNEEVSKSVSAPVAQAPAPGPKSPVSVPQQQTSSSVETVVESTSDDASPTAAPPAPVEASASELPSEPIEPPPAESSPSVAPSALPGVPPQVHEALSLEQTIELFDTPLADVIELIEFKTDQKFLVDYAALEAVGIARDHPLTLDAGKNQIRRALRWLFEPLGADVVFSDGLLVLTTSEKAEQLISQKRAARIMPLITQADAALQHTLEEQVPFDFVETPLVDIFLVFNDLTSQRFFLDRIGLKQEEITNYTTVTAAVKNTPLKTSLRLSMEPIGVEVVAWDGAFLVTTPKRAKQFEEKKRVVRFMAPLIGGAP